MNSNFVRDVYKEPTVKKKRIRASKNAEEEDHEDKEDGAETTVAQTGFRLGS